MKFESGDKVFVKDDSWEYFKVVKVNVKRKTLSIKLYTENGCPYHEGTGPEIKYENFYNFTILDKFPWEKGVKNETSNF